jgi:hypothetical protein
VCYTTRQKGRCFLCESPKQTNSGMISLTNTGQVVSPNRCFAQRNRSVSIPLGPESIPKTKINKPQHHGLNSNLIHSVSSTPGGSPLNQKTSRFTSITKSIMMSSSPSSRVFIAYDFTSQHQVHPHRLWTN